MEENKIKNINRNKNKKSGNKAVKILKICGTILLSMFLIIVITCSIFATALTIYVLNFADTTTTVSLENVTANYTSRFLYENPDYDENDPDSEEYLLYYALKNSNQKAVWTDLESVPQTLRDAVVYTEDERFYSHDGVDFKRTFAAFLNVFIPIYDTEQGGSTITQQTIKNVTGDDARDLANGGAERKIREIFRSINVEKTYNKEDILQCYLNIISLNTYDVEIIGVQAAANYYFGKDVSQIDLAESASLAAMIQSPAKLNPLDYPEENATRATYVLDKMLENGAISSEEHDDAIEELADLEVTGDIEYSSVSKYDDETKDQGPTSYFMDDCINQAISILMSEFGIDYTAAKDKLYSGGYTIYTTVDKSMQDKVEKEMQDDSNFQSYSFDDDELIGAFVAMDYSGNVKAIVGSREEKKESLIFNYASDGIRSPGSCIKPIASYSLAIENDIATYSSIYNDKPITIDVEGTKKEWPVNYSESEIENWTYQDHPLWYMLQHSINTCPAQLIEKLTPAYSYNYLQEKLGLTTMELSDADYSAMSVGGFTNGLHLSELVAAYQIFGNGGRMYETTYISSMVDKDGTAIYEHSDAYTQAISEASAYITNRMMQTVVTGGTATAAKLNTTDLVGKTGTTSDWTDLLFVGCTPDYVSGVWIGYDTFTKIPTGQYQNSAQIWKNIFGEIAENETDKEFEMPDSVTKATYCTHSGLLATSSCSSTATGYYKTSNMPAYCGLGY